MQIPSEKTPDARLVIAHFRLGAAGALLFALALVAYHRLLPGPYYTHRLFAVTHVAVLAWVTMIIFGALYQLLPVIVRAPLHSERLAWRTLGLFATGAIGLSAGFAVGATQTAIPAFAAVTYLAILLFAYNVIASFRQAKAWPVNAHFIAAAVLWLVLTATLGFTLALDQRWHFTGARTLALVHAHLNWGLIGWFLQLILGAGATLMPMFLVSHDIHVRRLLPAFYALNGGLLVLSVYFLAGTPRPWLWAAYTLIVLAIAIYISFLYRSFRRSIRAIDAPMQISIAAFAGLPVVTAIAAIILWPFRLSPTLYVLAALFLFVFPLLIGQSFKTLPFIVWLDRYRRRVGKQRVPMPTDLYSARTVAVQNGLYAISTLLILIGFGWRQMVLLAAGSLAFLATIVAYAVQLFRIAGHRAVRTEEIDSGAARDIKQLLRTIPDPELNVNIVDLGLIYRLGFRPEQKRIRVDMTLSTPACPVGDTIVLQVVEKLQKAYPGFDVDVRLVFDPPWTPDRITDEGRRLLGTRHPILKGK